VIALVARISPEVPDAAVPTPREDICGEVAKTTAPVPVIAAN
jgi:hypothetical protein